MLKRISFMLCACFIFVLFITQPALAETKIAVIDVQALLNDSEAAENVQKQLAKKRKEYQDEFAKYEQELRDSQETLSKEAAGKSKEDIQKLRSEFEKKILDTRKLVQERQITLEKAANRALQTLRSEIFNIVAENAEKESYTLVLSRQNVVLAEKSIDITQDVMKQLNKSVKKIPLEIEN